MVLKIERFRILIVLITVIIFFSVAQNVYATEPEAIGFTLHNLDGSNPPYSDGDTIRITFSISTDRGGFPLNVLIGQANVDDLFGVTDGLGTTYDGLWISDRIFEITIADVAGNGLQIGSSIAEPGNISIGDPASADEWVTDSVALQLFVNSGGDGCDGSCGVPTLGVIDGKRIVEEGFSYNGNPIDVESFFTPYPLIKTKTGFFNTAKLKIYDESGPENIQHVELSFGLAKGNTINERTASIFWDKHFDGTEIVGVYSPTNAIDRVNVISKEVMCSSDAENRCLELSITHRFRTPLDFDIVGTNIWNENHYAWQNYFNHGVHIQGESLNQATTHYGIHQGHLIQLSEIEKNVAIDNDGNTWIFDKIWKMTTTPKGKIDEGITSHLIDRNSALFQTYIKGQELLAQNTFDMLTGRPIQNIQQDEIKTHYSEFMKRSDDPELQKRILQAKHDATKVFNHLFDVKQNH